MLTRLAFGKLGTRFTLILMAVFVVGSLISYLAFSRALQSRAQDEVNSKGLILIGLMNSVRSYTTTHVATLLPNTNAKQQFVPETVPAFSAREVFENLRKTSDYANFLYKEATIDPTNPRDQADMFESDLVARFRAAPDLKEQSGYRMRDGEQLYYSARPFVITKEACLVCHSTPDKAPASMIAAYGDKSGFGWNLNDTIGTQIIYVPASRVLDSAAQSVALVMGAFVAIFALVLILVNFLLRRDVVRPLEVMGQIAGKVTAGTLDFTAAERDHMTQLAARGDELGQSARVFQTMTREVQAREQRLTQQLQQLRVEVDEARKQKQVAEITDTEYFQELRRKAQALRKAMPPTTAR